jgi:MFS family permease
VVCNTFSTFHCDVSLSLASISSFIDRTNIGKRLSDHYDTYSINLFQGNARLAGFEKDLKLKGYDYNTVLSVFYISYIIFEIPSTICCKVMGIHIYTPLHLSCAKFDSGPGWFLPLTTFGFGAASIATAFVKTRAQACAVRFILGIFESGVMPGCAYYLSRWYRRDELTFRLGLWMTMAPLSGAVGGLLASGILKLSNIGSLHGWQM